MSDQQRLNQRLIEYVLGQQQAAKGAVPHGLMNYIQQQTQQPQQGPTREAMIEYILEQSSRSPRSIWGPPVEAPAPEPLPIPDYPFQAADDLHVKLGGRATMRPEGWEEAQREKLARGPEHPFQAADDLHEKLGGRRTLVPEGWERRREEMAAQKQQELREKLARGPDYPFQAADDLHVKLGGRATMRPEGWGQAQQEKPAQASPPPSEPLPVQERSAYGIGGQLTGETAGGWPPPEPPDTEPFKYNWPEAAQLGPRADQVPPEKMEQWQRQQRLKEMIDDYNRRRALAKREYGLSRAADYIGKGFVQAAGYSGEGVMPGEIPQSWIDIEKEAKPEELGMFEQITGLRPPQGTPEAALRGGIAPAVGMEQAKATREYRAATADERKENVEYMRAMKDRAMNRVPAKTEGEFDDLVQTYGAASSLKKHFNAMTDDDSGWAPVRSFMTRMNKIATALGANPSDQSIDQALLESKVTAMFANYVKSISGAQVSAAEFARLTRAMAQTNYSPKAFRTLIEEMLERTRREFHSKVSVYEKEGRDLSKYRDLIPQPNDPFDWNPSLAGPSAGAGSTGTPLPSEMIRVRVGTEEGEIPADQWDKFKAENPTAQRF
jgi:hypothetical protein